jgi:DNA repair exonuclease SbcCD ATPase subunit
MHARLSAAIRKGKRIEAELRAKEVALSAAQQQIVELTDASQQQSELMFAGEVSEGQRQQLQCALKDSQQQLREVESKQQQLVETLTKSEQQVVQLQEQREQELARLQELEQHLRQFHQQQQQQQKPEQASTPTKSLPHLSAPAIADPTHVAAEGHSTEDLHARLTAAVRRGKRIEGELKVKEEALAASQQLVTELQEKSMHLEAAAAESQSNGHPEGTILETRQDALEDLWEKLQQQTALAADAKEEARKAVSTQASQLEGMQRLQAELQHAQQEAQYMQVQLQRVTAEMQAEAEQHRAECDSTVQSVTAEMQSVTAKMQAEAEQHCAEAEAARQQQAELQQQLQEALSEHEAVQAAQQERVSLAAAQGREEACARMEEVRRSV